ncbi:autotransporter assembly complex protein TamA [Pseudomonas sp. S9]|uniref:autotransporter assembly complex protein TamA n=1 Tax=Pseudomonas sp. S9 TaxID=686578 RepID=UPI0002556812|nr:autotransporter assembly complex family protein [Pseudomonas sp. S9]
MTVVKKLCAGVALIMFCASSQAESRLTVSIKPANKELKANVEGYIGSLGERDADALQRFSLVAKQQAVKAAQALGYYQAQISVEVNKETPPQLKIKINPGEPVHLRNVVVQVDGPAGELSQFKLPKDAHLKSGDVLNHGAYEAVKRYILTQASRYGFFAGKFTSQQLDIDPQAGIADVALIYESGPRYAFGDVTFSGDYELDNELLHRMVPFAPNTPYNSDKIAELYQALRSSDYFDNVQVDANPAQASGDIIPVDVQLTARKPRSMGLGLGFSTDVGPRGRANWTRHYANPQGHSYGAEMELSAPRQNVSLFYDVPLDPPLTDKFRFAGGYQYEDLPDTDTLSKLITVGPEWHSQLESGWQRVISLKWQHEEYKLGDDSGLSTLLLPGISYAYLHSDSQIDPSQGYRLQFDLSAGKEGLGSDSDVVHSNAMAKGLYTIAKKHRFLGRAQVGGTESNGFGNVPPSLRFFAGGDQSVRGYDYDSLSPENSDGDKIGGRYLVAGSVEYQYSVAEKWRVATFFDQGNSFNDLELPSLKKSFGFGIRWISPLGPLRLDLAKPINPGDDDDDGIHIHFSMGPEL